MPDADCAADAIAATAVITMIVEEAANCSATNYRRCSTSFGNFGNYSGFVKAKEVLPEKINSPPCGGESLYMRMKAALSCRALRRRERDRRIPICSAWR